MHESHYSKWHTRGTFTSHNSEFMSCNSDYIFSQVRILRYKPRIVRYWELWDKSHNCLILNFHIYSLENTKRRYLKGLSLFLSIVNVVLDPTDFHCMDRKAVETVFKITFVCVVHRWKKVPHVFYDMSKWQFKWFICGWTIPLRKRLYVWKHIVCQGLRSTNSKTRLWCYLL